MGDELPEEDEDPVLEVSPDGRWRRLKKAASPSGMTAVAAHIAYDTESGRMVVWNSVQFSEAIGRKNQKPAAQREHRNEIQDKYFLLKQIKVGSMSGSVWNVEYLSQTLDTTVTSV